MSFQNPLPAGIRQVVPDYVSDGATLTWSFPFRLWAGQDLAAFWSADAGATWHPLTYGTDYTVALVGTTGASVTLAVAQTASNRIRLMSVRTPARLTSVVNDGVIQSAPIESELDCIEATMQELRRDINGPFATAAAAAVAAAIPSALGSFWLGLPTTLPAAHGVLWNNGGVLCVS